MGTQNHNKCMMGKETVSSVRLPIFCAYLTSTLFIVRKENKLKVNNVHRLFLIWQNVI